MKIRIEKRHPKQVISDDNTYFDKTINQWVDRGDNPDYRWDKAKNQWFDTDVTPENVDDGAQMHHNKKSKRISHYE